MVRVFKGQQFWTPVDNSCDYRMWRLLSSLRQITVVTIGCGACCCLFAHWLTSQIVANTRYTQYQYVHMLTSVVTHIEHVRYLGSLSGCPEHRMEASIFLTLSWDMALISTLPNYLSLLIMSISSPFYIFPSGGIFDIFCY